MKLCPSLRKPKAALLLAAAWLVGAWAGAGVLAQSANSTLLPPADTSLSVALPALTLVNANATAPALSDEDIVAHLPSPTTPTRGQPAASANGAAIAMDTFRRVSPAEATDSGLGGAIPESQELADLAQKDRDFIEALAANPQTWPEAERDRRAQAINDGYLQYLDAHPAEVSAIVLYGKFLRQMGEREAANAIFLRANQLDSALPVVQQQLGNYQAEEGNYTAALACFNQAVALAPNEPLYHYQLGELLTVYYNEYSHDKIYDTKELDRRLAAEFRRAAELAPREPVYAWRYAESFYDQLQPDWNAALVAWDELGRRVTAPLEAQVVRLHRARVLFELGRLGEAQTLLDQPVRPAWEPTRLALLQLLAEAKAAPPPGGHPTAGAPSAQPPVPPAP